MSNDEYTLTTQDVVEDGIKNEYVEEKHKMSETTNKLEREVEPITTQNGKYLNLQLKNKYKVENGKKVVKQQGLNPGEYIIAVKTFPEGKEFPSKIYQKADGSPQLSFLCQLETKGESVSFFLKEHEHEAFKSMPLGEKIKVGVVKDSFVNPKNAMETFYDKVVFERM